MEWREGERAANPIRGSDLQHSPHCLQSGVLLDSGDLPKFHGADSNVKEGQHERKCHLLRLCLVNSKSNCHFQLYAFYDIKAF